MKSLCAHAREIVMVGGLLPIQNDGQSNRNGNAELQILVLELLFRFVNNYTETSTVNEKHNQLDVLNHLACSEPELHQFHRKKHHTLAKYLIQD